MATQINTILHVYYYYLFIISFTLKKLSATQTYMPRKSIQVCTMYVDMKYPPTCISFITKIVQITDTVHT